MSKNTDAIWNNFRYHAPPPGRVGQHEHARQLLRDVALELDEFMPDGREKSIVLTKLEEALFWANAGIARQPG
jgi:hypothetical protein